LLLIITHIILNIVFKANVITVLRGDKGYGQDIYIAAIIITTVIVGQNLAI